MLSWTNKLYGVDICQSQTLLLHWFLLGFYYVRIDRNQHIGGVLKWRKLLIWICKGRFANLERRTIFPFVKKKKLFAAFFKISSFILIHHVRRNKISTTGNFISIFHSSVDLIKLFYDIKIISLEENKTKKGHGSSKYQWKAVCLCHMGKYHSVGICYPLLAFRRGKLYLI